MVNLVPLDAHSQIVTFDDLQDCARGIHRLGVLRMDVDNLGDVFSRGLGDDATLSRLAALSRVMALFFEGRVGVIAERPIRCVGRRSSTPSMPVGMISSSSLPGTWSRCWRDASNRNWLSSSAAILDIHVSAGISLIGGTYPVYQAA
ncbi:MAG: hypothetical protein M5R40_20580 [Anaerolineae bacterium]|nr:hypothetical protein [Anaerolineae bacterium]